MQIRWRITGSFDLIKWTFVAMHPTNPNYLIAVNDINIAKSIPLNEWTALYIDETSAGLALVKKLESMATFIENQYSKK